MHYGTNIKNKMGKEFRNKSIKIRERDNINHHTLIFFKKLSKQTAKENVEAQITV